MSQEQQPFEGEAEATMPHICTDLSPRVVEAAQALGRALADFGQHGHLQHLIQKQIEVGWQMERENVRRNDDDKEDA